VKGRALVLSLCQLRRLQVLTEILLLWAKTRFLSGSPLFGKGSLLRGFGWRNRRLANASAGQLLSFFGVFALLDRKTVEEHLALARAKLEKQTVRGRHQKNLTKVKPGGLDM